MARGFCVGVFDDRPYFLVESGLVLGELRSSLGGKDESASLRSSVSKYDTFLDQRRIAPLIIDR